MSPVPVAITPRRRYTDRLTRLQLRLLRDVGFGRRGEG